MKVIYFKRNDRSPSHIHAHFYMEGIYIPDEKIILFREQQGTFGQNISSFTDRQEFLDEMQLLLKGRTPNIEKVTYSEIKEFEYDEGILKKLIQNARFERKLRSKVKSGIDDLLEKAK